MSHLDCAHVDGFGPRRGGVLARAVSAAGSWLLEPAHPEPEELAPVLAERPVVAVFGLGQGCGATVVARALAAELATRDPGGTAAVACEAKAAGIPLATRAASQLARALAAAPGVATRAVGRLCLAESPDQLALADASRLLGAARAGRGLELARRRPGVAGRPDGPRGHARRRAGAHAGRRSLSSAHGRRATRGHQPHPPAGGAGRPGPGSGAAGPAGTAPARRFTFPRPASVRSWLWVGGRPGASWAGRSRSSPTGARRRRGEVRARPRRRSTEIPMQCLGSDAGRGGDAAG